MKLTPFYIRTLILSLLVGSTSFAFGQSGESGSEERSTPARSAEGSEEEEPLLRHRVAILTGNTYVPKGDPAQGRTGFVVAPTYGIEYEYNFTHKFAVGVNCDMEVQRYVINTDEHEELEREFATVVALNFIYEPIPNLAIMLGPGREFETHKSFWAVMGGVSYAFKLPNNWDISPTFCYEFKENFDAWTLGISFGKRLGKAD